MAIKSFKPVTPVLRYKTTAVLEGVETVRPVRSLTQSRKRASGRNCQGRITVRHRGGGHKRHIRIVDFRRNKFGVPGVVERLEYDPNRTCLIALVLYADGERRYMLAPAGLKAGSKVVSAESCDIVEGNCMLLKNVPLGTQVHNIEIVKGRGGQIARTAGAYAEVVAKENELVQLRFPSGEIRNVAQNCYATLGAVGNAEHMNIVMGSAGRKRWMGWRPTVRGMAMNPVDHPMGGGEGRSKSGGGRQHPVSPWGQPSKGFKTRKPKKSSSKYIVRRRKK